MVKLDDMSWHAGVDGYPDGLPEENAATHIGFFLTWIIRNDLLGEVFGPEASAKIEAVRNGEMSGRLFLIEECDGKFISEMLKAEAIPFVELYYEKRYLRDYQETLVADLSSDYLVEDSEENYRVIATLLDQQFDAWQRGKPSIDPITRPWWKLW